MYSEDDLLPVSALQHLLFCERQCALIHLEGVWEENRLTVEGRQLHERADHAETEARPNVRVARGLRLHSLRLGLVGRADVVEFRRLSPDESAFTVLPGRPAESVVLSGVEGRWRPMPIEYKRGKPKPNRCDEVQLCAQALCLEEMLDVSIAAGAFFYGRPRRRTAVQFDDGLRRLTVTTAALCHTLMRSGRTPPAEYAAKCCNCSLINLCKPKTTGGRRSARNYLRRALAYAMSERPNELP